MKKYTLAIYLTIFSLLVGCQTEQKEEFIKGKLKRETISIASKVPGRVSYLVVEEGQRVQKGDTLAVIDTPEILAKLQQAEGAVYAANAQYQMALKGATIEQKNQVKAMLKAAQEQFDFAEKSYHRVKNMYKDSLVSEQKYDEVYTKYLLAKTQLEGVHAKNNEVEEGAREEKIRMAKGTLDRAQGTLQEVQVALRERYIIAPASMNIETVALKEGELALPGYNIFVGYDMEETFIRSTVGESLVHQFKIGDQITVQSFFDPSIQLKTEVVRVKELPSYANRTTMKAGYEMGEPLFELKLKPLSKEEAQKVLTNTTMILQLN